MSQYIPMASRQPLDGRPNVDATPVAPGVCEVRQQFSRAHVLASTCSHKRRIMSKNRRERRAALAGRSRQAAVSSAGARGFGDSTKGRVGIVRDTDTHGSLSPESTNRGRDLAADKEVAYYEAMVNGWVATRLEFDKNLVALSAGGIGLFLTLLTTIGVRSWWEAAFYGFGSIGFGGTIVVGLLIFRHNADFFEELVNGGGQQGSPLLNRLDKWLVRLFLLGATGALLAGGSAALSRHNSQEGNVAKDAKQDRSGPRTLDSTPRLDGMHQESVDGFQNMRPKAIEPTQNQPATHPPAQKKP